MSKLNINIEVPFDEVMPDNMCCGKTKGYIQDILTKYINEESQMFINALRHRISQHKRINNERKGYLFDKLTTLNNSTIHKLEEVDLRTEKPIASPIKSDNEIDIKFYQIKDQKINEVINNSEKIGTAIEKHLETPSNNIDNTATMNGGYLRYNKGKLRISLIPVECEEMVNKVFELGAVKYDIDNWKKAIEIVSFNDSLHRHFNAIRKGELIDPESGCSHYAHIVANAYMCMWLINNKPEIVYENMDKTKKTETKQENTNTNINKTKAKYEAEFVIMEPVKTDQRIHTMSIDSTLIKSKEDFIDSINDELFELKKELRNIHHSLYGEIKKIQHYSKSYKKNIRRRK